jgi:glycosyltransferase involved in cell wall biosynthesis
VILLSHPTANQNVRQAVLAFAEAGLLDEFWTCINWREKSLLDSLASGFPRLRRELRRRSFVRELQPYIHTVGWREWGRQFIGQLGWQRWLGGESGVFGIDAVYQSIDRRVAKRIATGLTSKVVYAYDDGAVATFRAAKARGILCIYEHPIVHWRTVRRYQEEEAELRPEWVATLSALTDSAEKLARKDEELGLADAVITPASFAKQSILEGKMVTAPIHVLPYGTTSSATSAWPRPSVDKLRVIFVGALTQAKGLGYLLDAVEKLGDQIEFSLVGRRVSAEVPVPATLGKYRWIPSLPHPELLQEMSRHDVLVLPSLHEGFGLVMTEAMSQGLVVITTSHTAGPDLISDGTDGFIIPIRSSEAIEEKLILLSREKERCRAMQEAAKQKALTFQWENYRRRLVELAREVVGKRLNS